MSKNAILRLFMLTILGSILLAACKPSQSPSPAETPSREEDATAEIAQPSPTSTTIPLTELNVCIAQEPESLFRYDGRNSIPKQSIFAALYGPQDGAAWLLDGTNGNMAIETAQEEFEPEEGMLVLAANGNVEVLREGMEVFLPGQSEPLAWAADNGYLLKRSSIVYKIKSGLLWSDGAPLTSADFLYSYHLARRLSLPEMQWAMDRTAKWEAVDEQTLRWTGIPGYTVTDPMAFFWKPLPAHLLESLEDEQLAETPTASLTPPGWGWWRIVSWQKGSKISLERNPHFGLSGLSLSPIELLNFFVVPDLDQALSNLNTGECHILDKSYHLEGLSDERLTALADQYQLVVEDYQAVEQLVFGVRPADFDEGYDSALQTRQDLFGDARTRQAILACINPPELINTLLSKEWMQARVADGMDIAQIGSAFPGIDGHKLLSEVGWDSDRGADGIRVASGVANVLDGTPFKVGLLTGEGQQSKALAAQLTERLRNCGIAVEATSLPARQLYAPGPEGPLFGRKFDLAVLNWGEYPGHVCELYTRGQVPANSNHWIGANVSGMENAGFDYACAQGGQSATDAMLSYAPAALVVPQIRIWLASNELALPEALTFENLAGITQRVP